MSPKTEVWKEVGQPYYTENQGAKVNHVLSTILAIQNAETEEGLTFWMHVLVSTSDLLKYWRGTHKLDSCSAILVSDSG